MWCISLLIPCRQQILGHIDTIVSSALTVCIIFLFGTSANPTQQRSTSRYPSLENAIFAV